MPFKAAIETHMTGRERKVKRKRNKANLHPLLKCPSWLKKNRFIRMRLILDVVVHPVKVHF
jgi:hypothetical protein